MSIIVFCIASCNYGFILTVDVFKIGFNPLRDTDGKLVNGIEKQAAMKNDINWGTHFPKTWDHGAGIFYELT